MQGNPSEDQWFAAGNQYAPWHDHLLSWAALNLLTFVLSIGGAIMVAVKMRSVATRFLGLVPIVVWVALFVGGYELYGWAIL
jgi:hypothetical protein